jgi:S-adenosylmethionine decarboxylase
MSAARSSRLRPGRLVVRDVPVLDSPAGEHDSGWGICLCGASDRSDPCCQRGPGTLADRLDGRNATPASVEAKEGGWNLKALGQHLLIELYGCSFEALDGLDLVRDTMLHAASMVHATVLGVTEHRFDPHGVSVVVVIAESHLSIHTWPEYGYAAADVFTCGDTLSPDEITNLFTERFGAENVTTMQVNRGLLAKSVLVGSPVKMPLAVGTAF